MKNDKILLKDNHRRSFSSTLMIVDQLPAEPEDLMTRPYNTCCFGIKNDLDSYAVNQNLKVIGEAHKKINFFGEKYNSKKTFQSLQRIIDAKKTKIREILHNSKSKKMKGFGEFSQKLIKEFDKDIHELMAIADKIQY